MSKESPRFISPRVSERVGPSPVVRDVAITLYRELVCCEHVLATFEQIHSRYPSLPFRDLVQAMRLIAMFERETEGRA